MSILCHRPAFFASLFVMCSLSAAAWVPPLCQRVHTKAPSTTAIGMFDWFNPKAKPSSSTPTKEKKEASTSTHKDPVNDFLGNFFNQEDPVHEDEKALVAQEVDPAVQTSSATPKEVEMESPKEVEMETPKEVIGEAVHSGVVKWYNPRKGFGFIQSAELPGGEVFVHQSEIKASGFRTLLDGEHVEFQLENDEQGRPRATRVTGPEGGDLKITLRRKAREDKDGSS